jgi:hypothetical protein
VFLLVKSIFNLGEKNKDGHLQGYYHENGGSFYLYLFGTWSYPGIFFSATSAATILIAIPLWMEYI